MTPWVFLFVAGAATASAAECAAGSCEEDDASMLSVRAFEKTGDDLVSGVGGGDTGLAWPMWKAQKVSALFYRPHYACGADAGSRVYSNGNAEHARKWLEGTMNDPAPDFMGLSEMEYKKGLPGMSFTGYKDYAVLGATCNTSSPVADPIGLYYNTKKWKLVDSYPPSPKCRRYPTVQYGSVDSPWICPPGKSTATEHGPSENCCSCTNPDSLAADKLYGQPNKTYQDFQGSRPFVLGTFKSKESKRKVCVVTFNLPHPLLLNCTASSDADCFGNIDMTASRPGTAQLVRTIQRYCEQLPLIFMGDTNNAAPAYETSFMFSNPNLPHQKDGCVGSQLDVLGDPMAVVYDDSSDGGSPYTCCVDYNKTDDSVKINMYASDRVAASGKQHWPIRNFFKPIKLYGGSSKAGSAPPQQSGLYPEPCPGVDKPGVKPIQGFPCCGADEEHSPVMGKFKLYR